MERRSLTDDPDRAHLVDPFDGSHAQALAAGQDIQVDGLTKLIAQPAHRWGRYMQLIHSKAFFPLLFIAVVGLLGAASTSPNPSAAHTSYPFSTDRVTVKRIYRAKAPADGERAVIIKLFNPDHFYVGGLYWVLWVGDKPYDERQCVNETDNPSEQDMRESSTNQTRCFFVPERHWKEFRQGDPLFLTWGRLRAAGQRPFGRLDKRLIKKG